MPPAEPCVAWPLRAWSWTEDGEPCKPTQFDRRRMESLKVPVRALEACWPGSPAAWPQEVLKEAADELRRKGEL